MSFHFLNSFSYLFLGCLCLSGTNPEWGKNTEKVISFETAYTMQSQMSTEILRVLVLHFHGLPNQTTTIQAFRLLIYPHCSECITSLFMSEARVKKLCEQGSGDVGCQTESEDKPFNRRMGTTFKCMILLFSRMIVWELPWWSSG